MTSDVASPRSRSAAAPDRRADEAEPETETRQRVGRFDFAAHNCFACGQLNAGGLRLALHVDGDVCWTETVVAGDFQGWEGFTHGGVVAAILDEVMAWSLIGQDRLGFTARIEVDFRRPVRTGMPIRAEGWIADRRRRRFDTVGRIVDAATGDVLAEARAIYLGAPLAQEAALRERYDIRLVAEETS